MRGWGWSRVQCPSYRVPEYGSFIAQTACICPDISRQLGDKIKGTLCSWAECSGETLLNKWQTSSKEKYSNIYPTRCNVTQFILSGNCATCFGWYHHPSSGAQTAVSTASGICHTVIAICRYCGRVGTGVSVLWVAYASNGVTDTSSCRYSCLRSWWSVVVPPETRRAVSR